MEQADKERNRLLMLEHSHMHNTRSFNKTHMLMLAMEQADKERNRLLMLEHSHIHNIRQFSKTHLLILAMHGVSRQGEKQVTSHSTYTKHKIKLTG